MKNCKYRDFFNKLLDSEKLLDFYPNSFGYWPLDNTSFIYHCKKQKIKL